MQAIFQFELRRQLSRKALWAICVVFASIGLYVGMRPETPWAHLVSLTTFAPANVAELIGVASWLSLYVVGPLIADSFARDTRPPISSALLAMPFSNASYVAGKGTAGVLLFLLPPGLFGVALEISARFATAPDQLLPSLSSFVYGFGWLALPNACFAAAVVAAFATTTRSAGSTYFGLIGLFVLYAISMLAWHSTARELAELLDPFGTRAFAAFNAPLDGSDERARELGINGGMLLNRALWLCATVAIALVPIRRLRTPWSPGAQKTQHVPLPEPNDWQGSVRFSVADQIVAIARFEIHRVARAWPYIATLAVGVLLLALDTATVSGLPEATPLPVHEIYHQALAGGMFHLLTCIAAVFVAVDIMDVERSHRVDQISNALPVAGAAWSAGKLVAISALVLGVQLAGICVAIGLQAIALPEAIHLAAFAQTLLIASIAPLLLAMATVALMSVTNNRVMAIAAIAGVALEQRLCAGLSFPHAELLAAGWLPELHHSELIGFGRAFAAWGIYATGWICLVVGILVSTQWIPKTARAGWWPLLLVVPCALGAGSAAVIEALRPDPRPAAAVALSQSDAALYERTFRQFAAFAQPTLLSVQASVAVDGAHGTATARARFHVFNPSPTSPVVVLLLDTSPLVELDHVTGGATIQREPRLGMTIVKLAAAIAPREERDVDFDVSYHDPQATAFTGVALLERHVSVVIGTELLPRLGYNPLKELSDPQARGARGLGPPTLAAVPDPSSRHAIFAPNVDRLSLDLSMRACHGEQVVAPGREVSATPADGCVEHRFVTDTPIVPYFAIILGAWSTESVLTDSGTRVTVRHLAGQETAARSIAVAGKQALQTLGARITPYDLPSLDIVEVPRTYPGAQSFPGVMVLPEHVGFLVESDGGLPWMPFIVAHEVAHQWWGMRLVPAYAPGADVLAESMAQLSAVAVIAKSDSKAKRAILDYYTAQYANAKRNNEDPPLASIFSRPDVAYTKGLLRLNALTDEMGVDFDPAIQRFFNRFDHRNGFPVLRDLVLALEGGEPPDKQVEIERAFQD